MNKSLNKYIDNSGVINEYMRYPNKKIDKSLETDISNILSLMYPPTKEDLGLLYYRGIRADKNKLKVGVSFTNLGFTSCTTDLDIALDFSDKCCLFVFNIPKKIKIHRVLNSQEDEVILQPNLRFTITQLSKNQHIFREIQQNVIYVKITKNTSGSGDYIYLD
jgi:hypothetical protein